MLFKVVSYSRFWMQYESCPIRSLLLKFQSFEANAMDRYDIAKQSNCAIERRTHGTHILGEATLCSLEYGYPRSHNEIIHFVQQWLGNCKNCLQASLKSWKMEGRIMSLHDASILSESARRSSG